MRLIKEAARRVRRHLQSYYAFYRVARFANKRSANIDELLGEHFSEVHVVCPGPSAINILEYNMKDDAAVIFVNHAVRMASKMKGTKNMYYFSADGVRTLEVIHECRNDLEKCTSIFSPWHLFHVSDQSFYSNLDIIMLPKTHLSMKYGVETIDRGPNRFSAISKRPIGAGFGSLVYTLQLAASFSPEKILLWGCDFGNRSGKKYFDSDTPVRNDTPFDLIKEHFEIVVKALAQQGVVVEFGVPHEKID